MTRIKVSNKGCGFNTEWNIKCPLGDFEGFGIELAGNSYDEKKDLIACRGCAKQNKYKNYKKVKVIGDAGTEYCIIYGVQAERAKCDECQKNNVAYKVTGTDKKGNLEKELNLCQQCKEAKWKEWKVPNCGNLVPSVGVSSDGSGTIGCPKCSFTKKATSTSKEKPNQDLKCEKCKTPVKSLHELTEVENKQTNEKWKCCRECIKCSQCIKKQP